MQRAEPRTGIRARPLRGRRRQRFSRHSGLSLPRHSRTERPLLRHSFCGAPRSCAAVVSFACLQQINSSPMSAGATGVTAAAAPRGAMAPGGAAGSWQGALARVGGALCFLLTERTAIATRYSRGVVAGIVSSEEGRNSRTGWYGPDAVSVVHALL